MHLSAKKLLLLGFIFVLLIAIPATVYLVKQQQTTQSGATAATSLSFSPSNPTIRNGEKANLDIYVDPANTNAVSFAKIVLSYDSTKLATVSGGVKLNSYTFAEGPDYGTNSISFSVNFGTTPQSFIEHKTKIATVTFSAIGTTEDNIPTQVIFANETQVLSAGGNVTNVLSSSAPAIILIASQSVSPTLTLTPTPTIASPPISPTITTAPQSTDSASATNSADLTATSSAVASQSAGLVCTSLTVDPSTIGTAPFSVNLTAVGSSGSSAAITDVNFDFGDGKTQDVTDSGGVGTDAVSVLASHTYQTSGTFNASATLTDENGNKDNSCTATITVGAAAVETATPTEAAPSPLPATGPSGLVAIGAFGAMLFFIGAVLLMAL